MTDEPAAPPVDHTIDALRYMMARLNRPQPEKRLPTILTPEVAKDALDLGVEVGSAFMVVKWTPEGLRYEPITEKEFYASGADIMGESLPETIIRQQREMIDQCRAEIDAIGGIRSIGGNIGGNGSDGA